MSRVWECIVSPACMVGHEQTSAELEEKVVIDVKQKILIVEDQQDITDLVRLHLGDFGTEVSHAVDDHEGMRMAGAMD